MMLTYKLPFIFYIKCKFNISFYNDNQTVAYGNVFSYKTNTYAFYVNHKDKDCHCHYYLYINHGPIYLKFDFPTCKHFPKNL